jgi:hypothetical protein
MFPVKLTLPVTSSPCLKYVVMSLTSVTNIYRFAQRKRNPGFPGFQLLV